jgi:hypothetical protein
MYSRQEVSRLRQEFWTAFGLYMNPVLSADGEKINWINYKTGEKYLNFRIDAGSDAAVVSIEFRHPDAVIRQLYFEQMKQLKHLLHEQVNEPWEWEEQTTDEQGKQFSRVFKELPGVSVFRKTDWPALVSFFKPRLIALDAFWSGARYSFEALR